MGGQHKLGMFESRSTISVANSNGEPQGFHQEASLTYLSNRLK